MTAPISRRLANAGSRFNAQTKAMGAPTPIGKQNASVGSVSKQVEQNWEFSKNKNNAKRTDITRTTVNDTETVTKKSKQYAKGKEQELHQGSGTEQTQKPGMYKELRSEPVYSKEFGTQGADGKTRLYGAGDLTTPTKHDLDNGVTAETYANGPSFEMTGGM
jgi:hypothetical protein